MLNLTTVVFVNWVYKSMIITVEEFKEKLKIANEKIIEDYIKGSAWTKNEVIFVINEYEKGNNRENSDVRMLISHLTTHFHNHYLYQNLYLPYSEIFFIDENHKIFIPSTISNIVSNLK
jgi:hypothetical protein